MIKQTKHWGAELRSDAISEDPLILSGQIKNTVDEALLENVVNEAWRLMELERNAATPKSTRNVEARAMEAYIERRRRLSAQIRTENPFCSEEEIEARLEQFGA